MTPAATFFPLFQVRLTSGIFADRQQIHTRHLMAIEADRLLAPFRIQAGLPGKAERYGGWESRDIGGHSLGHYLSALAYLHAATGNEDALSRVNHIVDELALCQQANGDGYVLPVTKDAFEAVRVGEIHSTPFSLNGVWVPFYTLHKVLAGLRDAFRLCGNATALEIGKSVCDWLEGIFSQLEASQIQQALATEHGGMNEVLADLSHDTGDPRYLKLASRCFHHHKVLDPMFRGEDRLNGLHGNTQIPKVVGLAREFELNSEPGCRVAAESFWEHVVNHRSYAIGGHGESEHFFPVEQFPQRLTPNTCETCNTYNLLKLTKHLFTWHPDAARMDFVERAMINHLAANIGREPGEFGYFLGLGSVGVKVFSTPFDSWWCCVGTGLENPVRYGEQIYAHASDTLWVNLFIGSTLEWPEKGLQLNQETRFPDEDVVRFSFECFSPINFSLRIRHPHWCAAMEVLLNGQPVAEESAPATYLTIERVWNDGDSLELRLPMSLRLEPLSHSDGEILAPVFGPTVLAGIVQDEPGFASPSKERFSEHLNARGKTDAFPPCFVAADAAEVTSGLKPTTTFSEFLSVGVVRPGDLRFVPFHRIYEEQYAVYFPLVCPQEWTRRESEIRVAREAQAIFEAGTLDLITPGYQQPEVEHSLASEKSEIEDFADRKCRIASDGGWFSYQIKVDPAEPSVLAVTYWGGVWHERNFDMFVDDTLLACQQLLTNRPGDFFDQYHDIPAELTAGKSRITLRFQSRPGDIAGGVFGLRMLRASAAPGQRYEQTIVFKGH
jgi:uncharacterized protein